MVERIHTLTISLLSALLFLPIVFQSALAVSITDSIDIGHTNQGDVAVQGIMVYVANTVDNTITVINSTSTSVVTTIDVSASCNNPEGLLATAAILYVACQDSNTIIKINTTTNTILGTLTSSVDSPFDMAIDISAAKLYVSSGSNYVKVVDTVLGSTVATINLNETPYELALYANKLFVTIGDYDGLEIINTLTNTLITNSLGTNVTSSFGVVVNPVTAKVYVTNYQIGQGFISVINATSNQWIENIQLGENDEPYYMDIDLTKNVLFVGNTVADTLTIVNATSNSIIEQVVPAEGTDYSLLGIGIFPLQKTGYFAITNVSDTAGKIKVIDYSDL